MTRTAGLLAAVTFAFSCVFAVAQSGYPGFEAGSYYIVLGPAGRGCSVRIFVRITMNRLYS